MSLSWLADEIIKVYKERYFLSQLEVWSVYFWGRDSWAQHTLGEGTKKLNSSTIHVSDVTTAYLLFCLSLSPVLMTAAVWNISCQ